jgi:hypothetical protein
MNERYELKVNETLLTFKTPFFRAEKGSVLHSGIYNKEMASIMASSIVTASLFVYLAFTYGHRLIFYILVFSTFAAGFIFFRMFIFRERNLCLALSRADGRARIERPSFIGSRKECFPIEEIESIGISHRIIEPENIDGIRVVEKIALQHGTVIPGFGEELEIFSVEIKTKGGKERVIYADNQPEKPMSLAKTLREFIGIA